MHKQFQELIAILGKELVLFKELHDLLESESKPIVEFHVAELENINKAKQTLELRLKIVEQARLEAIVSLAGAFNLHPEQVTLKKLSELAPPGQKETLLKARSAFKSLTVEIKDKIDNNGRLVGSSLRMIHGLQRLIFTQLEEPATYENAGKIRKKEPVFSIEGRRV